MSGAPIYEKIGPQRYRLAGHCVNGRFVRESTLKTFTIIETCMQCRERIARYRCVETPPIVLEVPQEPRPKPQTPKPTPPAPIAGQATTRTMRAARQAILAETTAGVPELKDTLGQALQWKKAHGML
jgi:hypothetical protein